MERRAWSRERRAGQGRKERRAESGELRAECQTFAGKIAMNLVLRASAEY
jgi:hypothetical protein